MIGLHFRGDNENRAERKARFLPQIEYTFAHKNHLTVIYYYPVCTVPKMWNIKLFANIHEYYNWLWI